MDEQINQNKPNQTPEKSGSTFFYTFLPFRAGCPQWSTASKLSFHSFNGYVVERESLYMSSLLQSLNQYMHLGRQILEFFWLALSSHHITEFPHHSTFYVYVTITSWTPGKACPISNILGVAHTSTCPLDFVDYIYTAPIQLLSFMFTL
jgi:hypothetical protein